MAMHATMIASRPPDIYWLPESVAVLHQVRELHEAGTEVYAIVDAGPNVKLLFLNRDALHLLRAFPELGIIRP